MPRIYTETFDDGPGGWVADLRNPLPVWDGIFVESGHSTDLTDARATVRLRGTMDFADPLRNSPVPEPPPGLGSALLLFLVQANLDGPPERAVSFILTGQPLEITPDPREWTSLGARHDLTDVCGDGDLTAVLGDVNHHIIFILFPLTIVPVGEVDDIHRRWATRDYKVDMQYLPKGLVMFDTVQIEYPE